MLKDRSRFSEAIRLAREFGASRLLVFGSYLEDPDAAHDLDLAVSGVNGWKLYELAARLELLFKIPLDLISLDEKTPVSKQAERYGEVLYAA